MLMLVFQKLEGMSSEGVIIGPEVPAPVPFRGCGDLLLKMDGIYDRLDFPEASRKMRRLHLYRERLQKSLTGEAAASEEPDATDAWGRALALRRNRNPWLYPDPVRGKTALCVCTQYRQHNSWQGYLYGENQQKVFFRSALELLYLLDDFLREQTEQISGKVGKTGRMGE